ncbi:MAG: hypothetical protein ABIH34_04585 [Nanoarchaeota archaeon]
MSLLDKLGAIVIFPLSIIIILEVLGVYTVPLPFDKILIGALLMIAFQVINVAMLGIQNGHVSIMQILTGILLILPPVAYFFQSFIPFGAQIPLILGVMMFTESLYALH